MIKKKFLTQVSIFFIVIGIIFAAIPTNWSNCFEVITFIATLLGFVLAGISLVMPNKYSHVIKPIDWIESDKNDYYYIITEKTHGMGKKPKCSIYNEDGNGNDSEIITDNSYDDVGNLKITVGQPQSLDIKVVIS